MNAILTCRPHQGSTFQQLQDFSRRFDNMLRQVILEETIVMCNTLIHRINTSDYTFLPQTLLHLLLHGFSVCPFLTHLLYLSCRVYPEAQNKGMDIHTCMRVSLGTPSSFVLADPWSSHCRFARMMLVPGTGMTSPTEFQCLEQTWIQRQLTYLTTTCHLEFMALLYVQITYVHPIRSPTISTINPEHFVHNSW